MAGLCSVMSFTLVFVMWLAMILGSMDGGTVTVVAILDGVEHGDPVVLRAGSVDSSTRYDYEAGLWSFTAAASADASGNLYLAMRDRYIRLLPDSSYISVFAGRVRIQVSSCLLCHRWMTREPGIAANFSTVGLSHSLPCIFIVQTKLRARPDSIHSVTQSNRAGG